MSNIWAAQWYSKNKLDGENRHLIRRDCVPVLFRTRSDCRSWINANYGYIKKRSDLRDEPHGWRMPAPVKVKIDVALP